jgi:predicted polyphosphate/ATP-dependent NAD kinase
MKRVGVIVNPVAGMGGAIGLKGTDGPDALQRALSLGAKNVSFGRASEFLRSFGSVAKSIDFLTCPGMMGEEIFKDVEVACNVIPGRSGTTDAGDTKRAARRMEESAADMLVFCGGDGTARDVLDAIGERMPALGVPSGVKMHSGVFAVNPRAAANIVMRFLWGELPLRQGEVADVDEEAFRSGRVSSRLYGYLLTPYEPAAIQGIKTPTPLGDDVNENKAALARWIAENMVDGTVYILGPGSTVKAINDLLGLDSTLLGVDLVQDHRLIGSDASEEDILKAVSGRRAEIIVSPIGGQGFIFGRGNQQISARVLRIVGKQSVTVISTREKIEGMSVLRVDTGDAELDEGFKGHLKVLIDYGLFEMIRVD